MAEIALAVAYSIAIDVRIKGIADQQRSARYQAKGRDHITPRRY